MSGNQNLLTSVPLFAKLPKKTIDRLDRLMVEREFPAGAEMVSEGEAGVSFFLIKSGKAEVIHGQQNLRTLGPGEYFGEMTLLDGRRRSATVRAVEPTDCLILTRWDFTSEVRSNPDLALELLEGISVRLRDVEEQLGRSKPSPAAETSSASGA